MITPFNSTDKVLVLDFDHTCYDTDAFLLFEIRQAMIHNFNIPVKEWEEAYESAAQIGYSLEQHLKELVRVLGHEPFTLEDIQNFEKKINFDKYLYEDVLSFLSEAKQKGYKVMILSFGETGWQDKKVLGVGLDTLVDVIEYTKIEGGKTEMLRKYTEGCAKVIFVENNGHDIDEVGKALPYVETYFMNRVPNETLDNESEEFMRLRYMESRKIAEKHIALAHKRCDTFIEVIL